MAAELDKLTGSEAILIKGANGIFDVIVDGTLLFSKGDVGRFPEPGEIAAMLPG